MTVPEIAETLRLLNSDIAPGERKILRLGLPSYSSHLPATVPVMVVRGKRPGPRLCITSAIHGDEVIGVEIIDALLSSGKLDDLICGDVVVVPVVNIFGFFQRSRYLPDRRDLNRSFPGSSQGSLAGRVAHLLLEEVISKCSHLIDLHSGAVHRYNLPQIRVARTDELSLSLARIAAPPLILRTESPGGSLRHMAMQRGMPALVFEGSEAERFDAYAADTGWWGIVRIMQHLGMIEESGAPEPSEPFIANSSKWIYASEGGIFRSFVDPGQHIDAGQVIGSISDIFGQATSLLTSDMHGIVIGKTLIPVIHEGDALFHIAHKDVVTDPSTVLEANPPPAASVI